MKYAREFKRHFSKKPVFSMRDIKTRFARQGISNSYASLLIHNLVKKREIFKVLKGFYTFQNDPIVAVFALQPCYIGLQDALSMHGLWEQETIPVLITPRKVRTGIRKVLGCNVLIKRIKREMFFGFESIKHFDYWLPVSGIEKTLIDFYYFKQPLSKQVLQKLLKKADKKKLQAYLKKASKQLAEKVRKQV